MTTNSSDNTTLPAGTGGDVIRTELVDYDTNNNPVKVQLIKLINGRGRINFPGTESTPGVDDGAVTDTNPFPVIDHRCRRLLEEILLIDMECRDLLTEIRDAVKAEHAGGVIPNFGRSF